MTTARILRQRLFEVKDQDAPMSLKELIEIAAEVKLGEFGEGDVNDFIAAEKFKIDQNAEWLKETIEKEARKILRADIIADATGINAGAWERGIARVIEVASHSGPVDTESADYLAETLDAKIEELISSGKGRS